MQQDSAFIAKQFLSKYKNAIDKSLLDFFDELEQKIKSDRLSGYNFEAVNILKDFSTRPGKRLRGSLAWFTYQTSTDKANNQTGKCLALALELIQNYLLIIDDVTDRSIIRRGKPTIHEIYKNRYKLKGDNLVISNMMAVNIGLLAQHFANEVILVCDESLEKLASSLKYLHQNIIKTCYGQIDDMMSIYGKEKINKDSILKIYEAKSSYYTFISPMQIGLAMAGIDNIKVQTTVKDYGRPAGIAFQLHDDVMGMFGNSQKTGKPNVDDLREGKQTLLVAYTREMASGKDLKILESALGNQKATANQHKQVCQIMIGCGAKKRVEDEAIKAAAKAKKAINNSKFFKDQSKQILSGIVDYSITRNT